MKSEVFNMDCLEAMRQMPDKCFDLAIVDPPYGIGAADNTGRGNKRHGAAATISKFYPNKDWDNAPPEWQYFSELKRISSNWILWGANHYLESLFAAGMRINASCWVVWDKVNGENDYADCELALTSFLSAVRRFQYKWHGMLQNDMKNKEVRIHPTQKPVALYRWLLSKYAKPGDRILDTHLGSGSSRIAAYDMGFDFTGYELDKEYFDAADKRFQLAIQQQSLF